ncbi:MAG: CBU_0592 family membrane protein [Acidimicrobiia bacterium]
MEALFELVGAVQILSAFVLSQMRRLDTTSLAYLLLNLSGSGTLAVVAAIDGDAGFLLLEGVWAVVSAYGLVRFSAGRSP